VGIAAYDGGDDFGDGDRGYFRVLRRCDRWFIDAINGFISIFAPIAFTFADRLSILPIASKNRLDRKRAFLSSWF
jgi:hypothetical protein